MRWLYWLALVLLTYAATLASGLLQALLFGRDEALLALPEPRTLYWRIVVPLLRPDRAMRVRRRGRRRMRQRSRPATH